MIIEKEQDDQFETNFENKKAFTIKATAKSFSILSKNLYRNSIRAGIRELCCNAVDAHIDNNNECPYDVHLPSVFAPEFYVKDFGVGMTTEELENVFTTYFDSTKTESNDRIGGLGLGSKSPFAYTSQYSIETSKNGIKTIALAYLDKDQMPNLSIIATEECGQSGTKVSYAVNVDDIDKFIYESVNVFLTLEKMPNIVNSKEDFYTSIDRRSWQNKRDGTSSEDYFEIIRDAVKNNLMGVSKDVYNSAQRLISNANGNDNPSIIMGGVLYSVALNEIFNSSEFEFSSFFKNVFKEQFVVGQAKIGDVSIQPSREALLYDEKTKVFFKKLISKFIYETVINCFDKNKSILETYALLDDTEFGHNVIDPCLRLKPELFTFEEVKKTFTEMFDDMFSDSEILTIFEYMTKVRTFNHNVNTLIVKYKLPMWINLSPMYKTVEINGQTYSKIKLDIPYFNELSRKENTIEELFNKVRNTSNYIKFSDSTTEFFNKVLSSKPISRETGARWIIQLMASIWGKDEHQTFKKSYSKTTEKLFGSNHQPSSFGLNSIVLINPLFKECFKELGIDTDFELESIDNLIEFPKKKEKRRIEDLFEDEKIFIISKLSDNYKSYNGVLQSYNDIKNHKEIYYIVTDSCANPGYFNESIESSKMTYNEDFTKCDYVDDIERNEAFVAKLKGDFGFFKGKIVVRVAYGNFKQFKIKEKGQFKNLYREYEKHLMKNIDKYKSLLDIRLLKDCYGGYMHISKSVMSRYEASNPGIVDTLFYKSWELWYQNRNNDLSKWDMEQYENRIIQFFNRIKSSYSISRVTCPVAKIDNYITGVRNSKKTSKKELDVSIYNRYPMIEFANSYSYNENQSEKLLDYVMFVEKQYADLDKKSPQIIAVA